MRLTTGLLMSSVLALAAGASAARADAFLDQAKATVKAATEKSGTWDGPTSGPAGVPGKSVVIVAGDLRNGGHTGVANGSVEAAKALGWTTRVIDGQGTVAGVSSAMSQAIALKPDGIINAGFDLAQNMSSVEEADKQGIKMVAWHGGPTPGPVAGTPVFFNVTTDPDKVAEVSAMYAVAQSDGKAGVVVFTDSAYAIAIKKSDGMAATIKKCAECKVLSVEDTPLADVANRMPQLTTSLLQRFGDQWTYSLGINDLYYDFMGPSLGAAGKAPEGPPMNISGGDGSESAYQRIRTGQYQVATVPEPLTMQGWQLVDELNRAFAGEQPSGYFAPVHLVVQDNIAFDGGDKNIYDPDNGYRDAYEKIWKVQ